jgi:alkanesulfonate monooxygenase SsuD/methylene tetrahydromethanopterin reductase-like flavin-dependent oxidoreductase (luciferase family)
MGQAPQVVKLWREKMAKYGHPHAHIHPPVSKSIYVAPTMEDAERDPIGREDFSLKILAQIGSPISRDGRIPPGYETWASRQKDRERAQDPGHAGLPPLRGTPEVVIERLKLVQEQGMQHIFGSFGFPGLPHEKVMRSIEMFATQVMPHFRDAPVAIAPQSA